MADLPILLELAGFWVVLVTILCREIIRRTNQLDADIVWKYSLPAKAKEPRR